MFRFFFHSQGHRQIQTLPFWEITDRALVRGLDACLVIADNIETT